MRIARTLLGGTVRIVVWEQELKLAPIGCPDDPLAAIDAVRSGASAEWESINEEALGLVAPVSRPGKIVAVGLNYADHTSETGFTQPERPLTFAKYPSSIAGPASDILVPDHLTNQVDYEAELAVVIGRRCGGAHPATIDDVAAYTVANDVSARDVQFSDGQWHRAKSFDTFTPLGPWLVTPDEFGAPDGHRIYTTVKHAGEDSAAVLQDDSTSEMIFDVPALLAFIGDGVTLERGDIILTGTPAGAGGFRTPPRYLQHGDLVTVGVEGIGELRNRVVLQSQSTPA